MAQFAGAGQDSLWSIDLFRFHRWLANLRVLEVEAINAVPYPPVAHSFVACLIGTIRREYLDRVFFWNAADLVCKLKEFKHHCNFARVHRGLAGATPAERAGVPSSTSAALDPYVWQQHCRRLFQVPVAA